MAISQRRIKIGTQFRDQVLAHSSEEQQKVLALYRLAYLRDLYAALAHTRDAALDIYADTAAACHSNSTTVNSIAETLQRLQKQIAFDDVAKRYRLLHEKFSKMKTAVRDRDCNIAALRNEVDALKAEYATLQPELTRALQPDQTVDLCIPPISQASSLTSQLNRLHAKNKLFTELRSQAEKIQAAAEWLHTEITAVRAVPFDQQSLQTEQNQLWNNTVQDMLQGVEAERISLDTVTEQIALMNQSLAEHDTQIAKLLLNDFAFAHSITDAGRTAERDALDLFQAYADAYFAKMRNEGTELPDTACAKQHIRATATTRIHEMQKIAKQMERRFATNSRWGYLLQKRKAMLQAELTATQGKIKIAALEKRIQQLEEKASESHIPQPRLPSVDVPFVGGVVSTSAGLPLLIGAIAVIASNPVGWAFGLLAGSVAALSLAVYLFHWIYKQAATVGHVQLHKKSPALQTQVVEQDKRLQSEATCLQQISYDSRMQLVDNGILIHSQFPDKFKRRGYKIVSPDHELQPCSMMTPVEQWVQNKRKACDVSDVAMIYNRRTHTVMFPLQSGEMAPVRLAKTRREIETQVLSRRSARAPR